MSSKKNEYGVRKFLSYYTPFRGLFIADLCCAVLVSALALLLPVCVRYITGTVIATGSDNMVGEILRMSAVMLAIIAAQTGFSIFYDFKGHDMGAKMERNMRLELFEHYQKLPFSFFDSQNTGQLMSRLVNDLLDMAEMCHHTPENIMIHGTQFIGSFIILFFINWKLTLIIFIILLAMAFYSVPFYKKMNTVINKNRQRIADVNSRTEENLSGIRTVKSFASERLEIDKFKRANDGFYKGRSDIYKYQSYNFQVI